MSFFSNYTQKIFFVIFLFLISNVFASLPPAANDPLSELVYAIMIDSVASQSKITSLIELCLKKPNGYRSKLPSRGQAVGILDITEFPLPMAKMELTITSDQVQQIFKTSCFYYSSDLSPDRKWKFLDNSSDALSFISHHINNGKYFTRFSYDMRTEWCKTDTWIMEKECTLPGITQVRGIFGYINLLSYFVVLTPIQDRTLRITAAWCDAGGKLLLIGKIRAKYSDVGDGITLSAKEITDYFR